MLLPNNLSHRVPRSSEVNIIDGYYETRIYRHPKAEAQNGPHSARDFCRDGWIGIWDAKQN